MIVFLLLLALSCLANPNTKLAPVGYQNPVPSPQFTKHKAFSLYHQKNNNSHLRLQGRVSAKTFYKRLKMYDISVKSGVDLNGMNLGLYRSLGDIKKAFGTLKVHITSGKDGSTHVHGKRSHYKGFKLDFSVKHWPNVKIKNKKTTKGKRLILAIVAKLNAIKGIKALYEEGKNFPHIDIQYTAGNYK